MAGKGPNLRIIKIFISISCTLFNTIKQSFSEIITGNLSSSYTSSPLTPTPNKYTCVIQQHQIITIQCKQGIVK